MLQVQVIKDVLPYHQLMTPKWLHKHSTIAVNYTLHPQYLEVAVTGRPKFKKVLQVKLVAPGILKSTDIIGVTMTIAMDTELANAGDHDPSFGISDGKSFVGYTAPDKIHYVNTSPCRHVEGDIITGTIQNYVRIEGPQVATQSYSSEITLQFRPTEKWGSCHTEHGNGYVNIANYQHQLDITKGLYLQMYYDDDPEKYRIKYIVVDVHVD